MQTDAATTTASDLKRYRSAGLLYSLFCSLERPVFADVLYLMCFAGSVNEALEQEQAAQQADVYSRQAKLEYLERKGQEYRTTRTALKVLTLLLFVTVALTFAHRRSCSELD